MKKVLLIGLDGATWDLIMPWIEEGKLPTLKAILDTGVYGELESTVPPNTIPAWCSMATGKNPGKLGYFSWLTKLEGSYEFEPRFLYSEERTFWDILSGVGKKLIIMNVPNIHKATKINGCMVAGFLYFGQENLTYPKDLRKKLDNVVGGYEVDPIEGVLDIYQRNRASGNPFGDTLVNVRATNNAKYLKKIHQVMDKHFKASEFLLKEKWDFAFIVFVATDRVQHRFWADKGVLLRCYEQLDARLAKMLEAIDKDTTLIIVSDHGFGPKRTVFSLNEWLLRSGYLQLKAQVPRKVRTMSLVRKMGILSILKPLARFLPSRFRLLMKQQTAFRIGPEKIDWTKTIAFASPVSSAGEIYLNVRGREVSGIVSPEDYEKTRNEIRKKLMMLRNPMTGSLISPKVFRREELYSGKHLSRAPDLVILQDDHINAFDTMLGQGRVFLETSGKVGHHRINGIFMASGPNVKKGRKITNATIYDIAPTILHIFGMKPIDMDGRVLKEIFHGEKYTGLADTKVKPSPQKSREASTINDSPEREKILDRLRSLGYID